MTYLVLGNLTCAILLAVSGVAKLRAKYETRDAFQALHLPDWLRRSPAPLLLPWGELLLAALLVLGTGWVLVGAAVGAVALFAAYTVVIARALRFEEPVRCNCFGALGSHDVTPRTLARNLLILLLAVLGFIAAIVGANAYGLGGSGWGWVAMTALSATAVILSLVPASSSAGPTVGAAVAPQLSLRNVETGSDVRLRALAREHGGVVLLFVMSGCGGCERVLAQLPEWLAAVPGRVVVPVRPARDATEDPKWRGLAHLHEDWGSNVALTLVGSKTPAAVELDPQGAIVGSPASGVDAVRNLILGSATEERPDADGAVGVVEPQPVVEGEPAVEIQDDEFEEYERLPIPEALLLRADGEPVTLREVAARQAQLLVTIDCQCWPAREAISRVEEWQRRLPVLEVRLVPSIRPSEGVVPAAVEKTALYDHMGLAAGALGATGQVAAVLLGADGLIAGGPVVGVNAVEEFVGDIEAQLPPAE